jgi:hypothetical protein
MGRQFYGFNERRIQQRYKQGRGLGTAPATGPGTEFAMFRRVAAHTAASAGPLAVSITSTPTSNIGFFACWTGRRT